MMFGWRYRIGFISPTVMEIIPYDFYHIAPDGIGLVGVTCNIEDWRQAEYDKALELVDGAADYLASRKVDFIIHGGAPLVISRGEGFDRELIERIRRRTGVPATTTVRSAMDALEALNIHNVALASPYPDDLNEMTVTYLRQYGFEVVHADTLRVGFKELQEVTPSAIYRFVKKVLRAARGADGVYIPCPQWPVADLVEVMERDFGVPIVASDPADFWAAFRALGVRDRIVGYGRLLGLLSES